MSWIDKRAVRSFLKDIGASYTEFQLANTWYGRASFRDGAALVYCDFTLGDSEAIRAEDVIVGTQFNGSSNDVSQVARAAKENALTKYSPHILACKAVVSGNSKLNGKNADSHASEIVQITSKWAVALVEVRARSWSEKREVVPHLVLNGSITSLPIA